MLTQINRLTIYCILCFITICSLVLRMPDNVSLYPVVSLCIVVAALIIELHTWSESEAQED